MHEESDDDFDALREFPKLSCCLSFLMPINADVS